jgi:hypothetical protein
MSFAFKPTSGQLMTTTRAEAEGAVGIPQNRGGIA